MSEELVLEGFGRILAEARVAKGMSVADVSEKLKLTVRQVEALEAEDFSRLPSAVFVRGFAKNYARLLGISLDQLPGVIDHTVEPTSTITAHSEEVVFHTSPVRRWLVLPLLGVIVFLALVAALYNWLRRGEDAYLTTTAPVTQPATVTLPPVAPAEPPASPVAPATPTPQATEPVEAPTVPQEKAAEPVTPPAVEPKPAAVATPAAPASYSYGTAYPGRHTAHFAVQEGDSWVEVTTADQRRYAKLLRSGDQLTVHGAQPMQVVVGNAAHVQITYDDKPVGVTSYGSDQVARLTLQ